MFQDAECVDVLVGLGLTVLQAEAYLAVVKVGSAGVEEVSRVCGVSVGDAARVMGELEELGLAEKDVLLQGVYVAVPLREGLLGLLQRKAEANSVLQAKTRRLIDGFEEGFGGVGFGAVQSQFEVTSEKPVFLQKASASTHAALKSHDAILWSAGFNVMFSYGAQDVKGALSRGVRVRVITEEPENPEEAREMLRGFEYPNLTVKYVPAPVPICLMIFDDKEVHLRINEDLVPSFWSNNPHIINLSRTYFDEMWNKLSNRKKK
jgi:sugar-specific transcriptional regulator TrmB